MCKDKRPLEKFCAWCCRNLDNLNEYVLRDGVRWSQASHGICKDCSKRIDKREGKIK